MRTKTMVVEISRSEDEDRKLFLPADEAIQGMPARLAAFQGELLDAARDRREAGSHRGGIDSIAALGEALEQGAAFVYTGWSGDAAVEERVKAETGATLRCIPDEAFRSETPPESCVGGGASKMEVVWAKAY